jgi:hypothetical protein
MGLSEPVRAAVDDAGRLAEELARTFLGQVIVCEPTGGVVVISQILAGMLALLKKAIFLVKTVFAIPRLMRYRRILAM